MKESITPPGDDPGGRAGRAADRSVLGRNDPKVIEFPRRRQARPRGSYHAAFWQQQCRQAGPVRLIIGFRFIALMIENWPSPPGWRVPDCFNVDGSEGPGWIEGSFVPDVSDYDLLRALRQCQNEGYAVAPAVFSPGGVGDPEALAVMERLARKGLKTSREISTICNESLLSLIDWPARLPTDRPRRSLRRHWPRSGVAPSFEGGPYHG
jgi:hypothetical protein